MTERVEQIGALDSQGSAGFEKYRKIILINPWQNYRKP